MTNWTVVLSKLNRDTQEGKLEWRRETQSGYDELYLAKFKEWRVGVFRVSGSVRWGLFDPDAEPLYEIQETTGLFELYESIQRQHAKADDFARAVLDDDVPF